MSDEPEPTPEELAAAQALADFLDGKPAPGLPPDIAATATFLQLVMKPPTAQDVADVKARLVLRRKPRWAVRAGVAAAIAASLAIAVWLLLARSVATPEPSSELLQAQADAIKSGDPKALDLAMQTYRKDLVKIEKLRGAEAVHTRADQAIAAGDLNAAREALTTLTGNGGVIERDAWFRLATVELRAGRTDAAIADADRGLALGRPADLFTVNLYLARAAAHRARGDVEAAVNDMHAAVVLLDALTSAALDGE